MCSGFLLFSFFYLIYWNTVDLQCCVSFRCTAKWISYLYIYVYPLFFRLFWPYVIAKYKVEFTVLCNRSLLVIYFICSSVYIVASMVAQSIKSLPAMWESWVRFLGREDPLDKEMTTHSIILAWIIPWTEQPGGYHPWGHKELDTTEWLIFTSLSMCICQSQPPSFFLYPLITTNLFSTSVTLILFCK